MIPSPLSLSAETINRLKSHAEPFVDTLDSVVNRAIDALEASTIGVGHKQIEEEVRSFNPAAAPNLSYTTVKSVVLNGKRFAPQDSKWNFILVEAAREAKKKMSTEKVKDIIGVNCVLGKKIEHGYKFYDDIGVSIQGQDANGAWKGIFNIVSAINASLELTFVWQDNAKAAFPNKSGRLSVKSLSTPSH